MVQMVNKADIPVVNFKDLEPGTIFMNPPVNGSIFMKVSDGEHERAVRLPYGQLLRTNVPNAKCRVLEAVIEYQ